VTAVTAVATVAAMARVARVRSTSVARSPVVTTTSWPMTPSACSLLHVTRPPILAQLSEPLSPATCSRLAAHGSAVSQPDLGGRRMRHRACGRPLAQLPMAKAVTPGGWGYWFVPRRLSTVPLADREARGYGGAAKLRISLGKQTRRGSQGASF
jgi:hypothetical protein